jgi:hypothetical protein
MRIGLTQTRSSQANEGQQRHSSNCLCLDIGVQGHSFKSTSWQQGMDELMQEAHALCNESQCQVTYLLPSHHTSSMSCRVACVHCRRRCSLQQLPQTVNLIVQGAPPQQLQDVMFGSKYRRFE